jgi:hypothetical protein
MAREPIKSCFSASYLTFAPPLTRIRHHSNSHTVLKIYRKRRLARPISAPVDRVLLPNVPTQRGSASSLVWRSKPEQETLAARSLEATCQISWSMITTTYSTPAKDRAPSIAQRHKRTGSARGHTVSLVRCGQALDTSSRLDGRRKRKRFPRRLPRRACFRVRSQSFRKKPDTG